MLSVGGGSRARAGRVQTKLFHFGPEKLPPAVATHKTSHDQQQDAAKGLK